MADLPPCGGPGSVRNEPGRKPLRCVRPSRRNRIGKRRPYILLTLAWLDNPFQQDAFPLPVGAPRSRFPASRIMPPAFSLSGKARAVPVRYD